MKCPGPLLAASGGDAAPHAPVEAAALQHPHPICVDSTSKACTSKKASATHLPHAPVQALMAQRILAKETTAAADDGTMDDAQQVLEESPTRLC